MRTDATPEAELSTSEVISIAQALRPKTPLAWRLAIAAAVLVIGASAYALRDFVGLRGQAAAGVFCFFGIVAAASSNLRAVNWRTIGWGVVLQIVLAVLVLKVPWVNQGFNAA